jgi:hypothetical protein
MTTMASIAELQSAGMKLEASEAVAIAQQLIQSLRGASAPAGLEPPYGPPTAATVVLNADGTVSCPGCGSTPAISEIAIFLDTLLPAGSPRVPGALRYTIARALLEVDVAPFDSLDSFSASLARHERGDRAEVIRRLLQRSESACASAAVAQADRRRRQASVTDLRRALREADARLYAQQNSSRVVQASQQPGMRTVPAIAACLGAGLMLIAAGELMQRSEPPKPAAVPVVAPAPDVVPATERALAPRENEATDRPGVATPVATLGSADAPATVSPAPESARPVERGQPRAREGADRVTAPRGARPPAIKKTRAERSGVLDRLKLRWLKKKFAIRADAL